MPPEDDPREDSYWDDHPDNPKNRSDVMSCRTCDKTPQKISDEGGGVFWCPCCGTLVERGTGGFFRVTTPALVERCRDFQSKLFARLLPEPLMDIWRQLGLAEAINPPGSRR